MPTVKTVLDLDTYNKLRKMRKDAGVPSVSALFLKKCGLLTEDSEAKELFNRALRKAKSLARGEVFRLRDLFMASEWEKFSKGARLRAGKLFHTRIDLSNDGIRVHKKSGAGHQLYIVSSKDE